MPVKKKLRTPVYAWLTGADESMIPVLTPKSSSLTNCDLHCLENKSPAHATKLKGPASVFVHVNLVWWNDKFLS